MKHVNLFNIRLSQIQIFLAAAEYGNFTVAAEKLHLTQPMVSKTITTIEKELGICLFVRTHGKLQVTPAGRELFFEWKNILKYFENSLENAHSIQEGLSGSLRIGTGTLVANNERLINRIREVRKKYPEISVSLEFHSLGILLKKLVKEELDIVIISKHQLPEVTNMGLAWKIMQESYLAIFVHKSNPLFERESISFEDLKTEKFIVFSPENDRHYISLLHLISKEAGFTPKIACYVPNEISFQANLLLGNGIVLADTCTRLEEAEIRKFPLEKYRNDLILVWRPQSQNGGAEKFLELF